MSSSVPIVIAIDGPAASGKSTIAKMLGERFGFECVGTGEMFRAVTWAVQKHGVDPTDREAIVNLLGRIEIDCVMRDGESVTLIDGESPGAELKSDAVNGAVSPVASIPEVRSLLVGKQRVLGGVGRIVMEGRDIGSVVFPETPYKLYIDASPEVRAARRSDEGQKDAILKRDERDSKRPNAPLKVADGAVVVDTSELSLEDAFAEAIAVLKKQGLSL